ncbi:MAG: ammonium transporter [Defluviitaleaceae bacterium]|nr:ammonium transporter [Defluviitaleaceae bacterium]
MNFGIWFLLAAGMVFFMQSGFAMVESGFTRSKNAANIIMKNLMDFAFGAVVFVLLGYQILTSSNYVGGVFGIPSFEIFTAFAEFDFADFVFNLVFCATAATIISGAVAERTKFSSYMVYSVVISAVIYPVSAGWLWNEAGWLAQLGFVDFAGSSAIHMLGGVAAFIGASVLGPRIGKYQVDKKTGKKISRAIPGHSLVVGALGCFILWFGWYGFNGAAAENLPQLGSIFLTTTLAPAAAAISAMTLTWLKNGHPDVSMTLNGALGGLVGITAGTSNVDALGALIIGFVAGILIVVAVELIDQVLHVDDPVGAVAVHGVCGIWGTLAVGLFAREIPALVDGVQMVENGELVWISDVSGLFYGGGTELLGVQIIGVLSILAWTVITTTILFVVIKKTIGLRASAEDEIRGLDATEHGMESGSYADFLTVFDAPKTTPSVPMNKAVTVSNTSTGTKLTKVTILAKREKFLLLKEAFDQIGITGITVTNVLGYGVQRGHTHTYRGVPLENPLLPKVQVDVVVSRVPVDTLVNAVKNVLYTGNIGDGKIFVYDVENVVKVRTGEEGTAALQDSEKGDS